MMNDLNNIIEATKSQKLHWEKEGDSYAFIAYGEDSCLYSSAEQGDGVRVFEAFDTNGERISYMTSDEMTDTDWPGKLYETILENNDELRDFVNPSVSLQKIKERLSGGKKLNIVSNQSFNYIHADKEYIEPNFSQQITLAGRTPIPDAQVITISAAGATGKTALTKYLSSKLTIPVFDMQQHEAVGSHSLLGMLFNTLPVDEFSEYIQLLKDGRATIIIDAMDEGYVKTGHAAFESFLNDIVSIAQNNSGIPFVIIGRTSIIEFTTMYLEEHSVKVGLLQIEPFIRKKAEEFIDIVLTEKIEKKITYVKEYKEVRNYILDSLQAFFKNESDISKKQSERFIGYAPVLLSIATLLQEEQNYHQLIAVLKKNNALNVELIRNIIEMILEREQGKIKNEIRLVLENAKYDDIEGALNRAYDITEQCARILCSIVGKSYNEEITDNPIVNEEYEKRIASWFVEHPFIVDNKIQNIVFEGFVVSKLIGIEKYRDDVITYLNNNWRDSYILFDLYNIMADKERGIDKRFAKYLIDSYKATEKGYNRNFIELTAINNTTNGTVNCELAFEKVGNKEYQPYIITLNKGEELEMPSVLSNMYIDAPVIIVLNSKHTELSPLVNICCKEMRISSDDLLITPSRINDSIIIECDAFEGRTKDGKLQEISNSGNVSLSILTDYPLYYPFSIYKRNRRGELPEDDEFIDKYQKMRRAIVQFRAHNKGSLAKYKEKIDNRVGNTDIGKRVIKGLLREGVLEEKKQMYFINDTKMSEKLGLGYNELRTYEVNKKVVDFLNSI